VGAKVDDDAGEATVGYVLTRGRCDGKFGSGYTLVHVRFLTAAGTGAGAEQPADVPGKWVSL
jgi:hypothetical protein